MSRDDTIGVISDLGCWYVIYCQAIENILAEIEVYCPHCGKVDLVELVDMKKLTAYHWLNLHQFTSENLALDFAKKLMVHNPDVEYGIRFYDTVDKMRGRSMAMSSVDQSSSASGHTPSASSSTPDEADSGV